MTWSDEMYRIHGYPPKAFPITFEKAVAQVEKRTPPVSAPT